MASSATNNFNKKNSDTQLYQSNALKLVLTTLFENLSKNGHCSLAPHTSIIVMKLEQSLNCSL